MTLSTAFRLPIAALAIVGTVAILPYAPRAAAQDAPAAPQAAGAATDNAPTSDQVFATVNGVPITAGDLLVAAEDYAQQSGAAPGNLPIGQLLNVLIDMRVTALAAEEAGLGDDDAVKRRLAFERMRTLRNAYLRDVALKAVTDEAVRKQYDKEIAEFQPQDELHLRHILVSTEEEGKQVIADIKAGGDFAEIAKERSKDPGTASKGGDLDFVSRGTTVPEFDKAAFALEVGQITDEPVKTDYGWHVIKLEEKRKSSPPEFATEENRIRNDMLRAVISKKIAELRAAADVQIVQPDKPAAAGAGTPSNGEAAPAEPSAQ